MVISLLARVTVKIVTDFTSIAQTRHPNEMGGAYWLFSFFLTMVSLPAAILYYENNAGNVTGIDLGWKAVKILIPITAGSFVIFLSCAERDYWNTFYSFQKGWESTVKRFNAFKNEEKKAGVVFKTSRHLWKSIEDDVKTWVEEVRKIKNFTRVHYENF